MLVMATETNVDNGPKSYSEDWVPIKNIMDGNNLDLSNRGLTQLNDIQGMLSQCSGSVQLINLSGNYLK